MDMSPENNCYANMYFLKVYIERQIELADLGRTSLKVYVSAGASKDKVLLVMDKIVHSEFI